MRYHWLNKQNSENLIVFFTGWSFDYKPFEYLKYDKCDILYVYDYNDLDILLLGDDLLSYKHRYLIAWSMGVYVAYFIRKNLPDFEKKIAVNGTVFPVHNEYGIPQKPFLLTLKHAKTGLEGKFYQNIFDNEYEFDKYKTSPVQRSIQNRVSELNAIYENINCFENSYEKYYDKAIISKKDKIVPALNQLRFWQTYETDFLTLESGHFPYYNYDSWKDLICL